MSSVSAFRTLLQAIREFETLLRTEEKTNQRRAESNNATHSGTGGLRITRHSTGRLSGGSVERFMEPEESDHKQTDSKAAVASIWGHKIFRAHTFQIGCSPTVICQPAFATCPSDGMLPCPRGALQLPAAGPFDCGAPRGSHMLDANLLGSRVRLQ